MPVDPGELRARMRADLVAAMKARDTDTVTALRTALAAIDNAEAVAVPDAETASASGPIAGARSGTGSTEVPRRVLDIAEVRALLGAQVADRLTAAHQYDTHARHDAANRLRREAAALQTYLPGEA